MNKLLYYFGENLTEGDVSMKSILGGKGANLAQMCKLNLPIPPGFTISTELCKEYINNSDILRKVIFEDIEEYIQKLEAETGKKFGGKNPLLLSVRSGAAISMPGMMDTILNLGINDEVVENLAAINNNPRFAYDSYRRFIEMFANVVLNIPSYHFEEILESCKLNNNYSKDSELTIADLKLLIENYKFIVKKHSGREFETNPTKQLIAAIESVLKSWNSPRAVAYRNIQNISNLSGTAVNIQSMVFGNKNDNSATGVVFTRNPSNGQKEIFGEFLINAQGEDVVAGIRTPAPIESTKVQNSMQNIMPKQYQELANLCTKLENYFHDMQDIEFTIEDGKLFLLQTRSGKRSAAAAVKIAVDMVSEGLISKQEAIMSIDPESLNQLLHTTIDYASNPEVIALGLPASPGAGMGIAVFSPTQAEEMSIHHKVILVRNDTSPEDIKGMHVSQGIITARGGMTSHAAVVARGLGKPCICGVNNIKINEQQKYFITQDGITIKQGDLISVDGSSGKIIKGQADLIEPVFSQEFETLLEWSNQEKKLHVRANAETVLDTQVALKFGAVGIGLCRTEHMFFDDNKIPLIRQMIVSPSVEKRREAIDKLKPMQSKDFQNLFSLMDGLPVNIRLLDPPLHEFLPANDEDKKTLAAVLEISFAAVENRLEELRETNPMLGHRGCRLGISHPEIYQMQVEAILDAIVEVTTSEKKQCYLELMIPLVSELKELLIIKSYINSIVAEKEQAHSIKFNIKLGTMIELPRSAIISDKIAPHVDYFSFGSNDLTQTTYGISRDDIGSFLPDYLGNGIFKHDPFAVIDEEGVGELIKISVNKGRMVKPKISLGICGEHAGNPRSIRFCDEIGLDYISCSPYRIPIARIAAAQGHIFNKKKK